MDQYFEALEKAKNNVVLNIVEQIQCEGADFLEKGRAAQMGEIRIWNGLKYQKTPNGWVPVKGEKKEGASEKKELEAEKKDEKLAEKQEQKPMYSDESGFTKEANSIISQIDDNSFFSESSGAEKLPYGGLTTRTFSMFGTNFETYIDENGYVGIDANQGPVGGKRGWIIRTDSRKSAEEGMAEIIKQLYSTLKQTGKFPQEDDALKIKQIVEKYNGKKK